MSKYDEALEAIAAAKKSVTREKLELERLKDLIGELCKAQHRDDQEDG